MPHRKKKQNPYQVQKLERIHHKKEFLSRLKYLINTIAGEDVCFDVPQIIFDTIYDQRSHSFKVIVSDGSDISIELRRDIRQILLEWIKSTKINLLPDKLDITLNEFYTVGITMYALYNGLSNESIEYVSRFKRGLNDFFTGFDNLFNQSEANLFESLKAFGIISSDIRNSLYWVENQLAESPDQRTGVDNLIIFHSGKLESVTVKINGKIRPLKRVGFAFPREGIIYLTIKPSVLEINSPSSDIPMNVYIQSHALQRLTERLDSFLPGPLHFNLFLSLQDPRVFQDSDNNLLIEYRFFDLRSGYLRVDIVDGMVVIRTFLFITNNGTPEGEKLEKITGLQKLDKKYLAIDKLSSFMNSDIKDNDKVRQIFEDSGCHTLLELYEKMQPLIVKHSDHFDVNLMLNYIASGKDNISSILKSSF
ncbi:MAG: hypothetical protein MUO72_13545 [Bacteroidales bacterium]|nr:hypothetical protein [Bacteroidales bacterium]